MRSLQTAAIVLACGAAGALAPGAAVATSQSEAGAPAAFLSAIEDLPLPPGFSEQAPGGEFDGPFGRVLYAAAEGEAATEAITAYYERTLRQLGWSRRLGETGLKFMRGRERLAIAADPLGQGRVRLRFVLLVQPASDALD